MTFCEAGPAIFNPTTLIARSTRIQKNQVRAAEAGAKAKGNAEGEVHLTVANGQR